VIDAGVERLTMKKVQLRMMHARVMVWVDKTEGRGVSEGHLQILAQRQRLGCVRG
jgi:hypothetical protein